MERRWVRRPGLKPRALEPFHHPARVKRCARAPENLDIFDFTLTEDELKKIAKLDKGKKYMKIPKIIKKGFALSRINFDKQK